MSIKIYGEKGYFVEFIGDVSRYLDIINFSFISSMTGRESHNRGEKCQHCKIITLADEYCKIIDKLKEDGLLDKDYKYICCMCYELEKMGCSIIAKD